MQTYKYFITEASVDKTWEIHGKNISSKISEELPHIPKEHHKETFSNAASIADQTNNKRYTPWFAAAYAKGSINKLEDAGRVHTALSVFDKHKHVAAKLNIPTDINKHSLSSLEDAHDTILKHLGAEEKHKDATDSIRQQTTHKEDEHWKVKIPHTEEASCHYGQGTKWCTAGKDDNQFSSYHQDGDLHIFIPKKPAYPGEKYQWHDSSNQFMNEKDKDVSPKRVFKERPTSFYDTGEEALKAIKALKGK